MWVSIHHARNVPEAYLVRDTLLTGGVDARVRGEQRAGIAGEIPMADAMAEVIVPSEQVLLARTLLAEMEEARKRPAWRCARCGEENPGSFDLCWSCGGS